MKFKCPTVIKTCVKSLFASAPLPIITVQGTDQASVLASVVALVNAGRTGTLYFPAGVYDVGGIATGRSQLNFEDFNNLLICGDGDSSVINFVSMNGRQSVRPILLYKSNNVEVANIKMDGNSSVICAEAAVSGQSDLEQQHNIHVDTVSNLYIHDVTSLYSCGDGLLLRFCNNVLVEDNYFDFNKRNGISIGSGAVSDVLICDNYFGANIETQQIDMEPEDYPANIPRNINIINNEFVEMLPEDQVNLDQYGVVLAGLDGGLVQGNTLDNPLLIRTCKNIEISSNTKVEQTQIDFDCDNITLCSNEFEFQQPTTASEPDKNSGIFIRELNGQFPKNIVIDSNSFNGVVGPWVVFAQDTTPLKITNNTYNTTGTAGDNRVHAQNGNVSLQFSNNSGALATIVESGGFSVLESNGASESCEPSLSTKEAMMPFAILCREVFDQKFNAAALDSVGEYVSVKTYFTLESEQKRLDDIYSEAFSKLLVSRNIHAKGIGYPTLSKAAMAELENGHDSAESLFQAVLSRVLS